jgi:hypothetical protein
MKRWSMTALLGGLLLVAGFASADGTNTIRIKVLDSQTRSVSLDSSDVPKNCDDVNFDAYCHNSRTVEVTNTLLVQEGDGAPFRISCTIDSKWSRCTPLPKGETFDARREKHGIIVYYADDNGKARKQLYALLDPEAAAKPGPAVAAKGGQASTGVGVVAAPQGKVKCNFTSTPSGAEITLDGKYAGSTPSVVNVGTGNHVVVMSLPGFGDWKRDLAVSSGSELTVNAVLEKAP